MLRQAGNVHGRKNVVVLIGVVIAISVVIACPSYSSLPFVCYIFLFKGSLDEKLPSYELLKMLKIQ